MTKKIPIDRSIEDLSLEISKNTNLFTKYSGVQVGSGNWKYCSIYKSQVESVNRY